MPIFHILQRYDPRDLQSNLASYRYNTVLNSVDRMLRKFVLEF